MVNQMIKIVSLAIALDIINLLVESDYNFSISVVYDEENDSKYYLIDLYKRKIK